MWFFQNDIASNFVRRVMAQPDAESDRTIAIVLGALIDNRLSDVITTHAHYDKKLHEEHFRDGGVFGSFAARSVLGFLMGIYTKETYNDLRYIIKIRNGMAHVIDFETFETQGIRELVDNLASPEIRTVVDKDGNSYTFDGSSLDKKNRREKFILSCNLIAGLFYLEVNEFSDDAKRQPRF